jgi:hypothetical protein
VVSLVSVAPAVLTLIYLIPVSIWWFAQLSIGSPSFGPISLQALEALLLTQVLCLFLFAPQWSSMRTGIKEGAITVAVSLLPTWPLFALLCLASGVSLISLAAAQALTAVLGLVFISTLGLLHRAPVNAEAARLIRASFGLIIATFAWLTRATWLPWVTSWT